MDSRRVPYLCVLTIILVVPSYCSIISIIRLTIAAPIPSNISALVFMGDSILDTGNNNYLNTLARVDHYPYGIDLVPYNRQATGRWSDGYIIPDILAELLHFPPPPAYLDPNASGSMILTGINLASGGSGLLNITLAELGVIPLSKQMEWYGEYRHEVEKLIGSTQAAALLSKAMHVISSGTNDYLANYYGWDAAAAQYNFTQLRAMLLQSYNENLNQLYDLGGRNVAVVGIPPMGCVPIVLASTVNRSCSPDLNSEAEAFNQELQELLSSLASSFKGFQLKYIDSYNTALHILRQPSFYGFTETSKGCCGDGSTSIGPTCFYLSPTCTNISEYFFFDGVHPTQRVYEIVAHQLFRNVTF